MHTCLDESSRTHTHAWHGQGSRVMNLISAYVNALRSVEADLYSHDLHLEKVSKLELICPQYHDHVCLLMSSEVIAHAKKSSQKYYKLVKDF